MKIIVIKTQAELDALPDSFDELTIIEIRSDEKTVIKLTKARDSSRVVAYGSSRVVACGSSRVEARGSSRVVAYDSSRVVAYDSSSVVAYGSSRVEACGSSRVEARGSSRVVAYDSSRVEAYDSSRVEAYDSSRVEARGLNMVYLYDLSFANIFSSFVIMKSIYDYSTAVFIGVEIKFEESHDTATIKKVTNEQLNRSFEDELGRGLVRADGIRKKLLSSKKIGEIEVFEVEEFLDRKSSYVVKKGDKFSHGETVEKAIEDLRYKISDRDTSRFDRWEANKDLELTLDEAIEGYRVITGACEMGTREFVESLEDNDKIKLSPRKILEITKGQFGNDVFSAFLNG